MDKLELIITLVVSAIGLITTILSIVFGTNNAKANKVSKALDVIKKAITRLPDFIATAEKVTTVQEERKDYVLNQAILYCRSEGVDVSEEDYRTLSNAIDRQVALSKEINTHSKTTTKIRSL